MVPFYFTAKMNVGLSFQTQENEYIHKSKKEESAIRFIESRKIND
jgi:hypothetical protein